MRECFSRRIDVDLQLGGSGRAVLVQAPPYARCG